MASSYWGLTVPVIPLSTFSLALLNAHCTVGGERDYPLLTDRGVDGSLARLLG